MKLIIFTTCKPFIGDDAWRQEQAIKSWTLLEGIDKIIIVVGNDDGTKEICEKYNLIYEPVIKNLVGIPYLHSMLEIGVKYADKDDYLLWTNSDMIYYNDMVRNILEFDKIKIKQNLSNFSLVGGRMDWHNPKILTDLSKEHFFSNINMNKKECIEICHTDSPHYECSNHSLCGIDYVIHSPTTYINRIDKNLVIAGTRHDMILVGTSIANNFYTCNITNTNPVIHQNHVLKNQHNHNNRSKSHVLIKNNVEYGNMKLMKNIYEAQHETMYDNDFQIQFN
jgi:hypothetical protein